MFLRLFSRAPLITIAPRVAGRRVRGVWIAALAAQVRAGQRPVAVLPSSSAGVPWKITCAAVLAGARPEVDHVVGGADRLLVVLDDDDGVAEIAQPGERRRAARGCRAGAGRSTARRARRARRSGSTRSAWRAGCAGLRRRTAWRRCGRASGSRRRRRRRKCSRSRISRRMRLAISALAIGELEAVEHVDRFGDRQVHVLRDRASLDPDRPALRLQPMALARRAGTQRAIRLEVLLLDPACPLRSAGGDSGSALRSPRRTDRPLPCVFFFARRGSLFGASSRCRPRRRTARRECFFGSRRNGSVEIDAEGPAQRLQRFAHQLPVALRPRRDRAVLERQRLVRHEPSRIEVVDRRQGPGNRGTRHAAS